MEKNGLRDPIRRPPPYTRAMMTSVFQHGFSGPQCKPCMANPMGRAEPWAESAWDCYAVRAPAL